MWKRISRRIWSTVTDDREKLNVKENKTQVILLCYHGVIGKGKQVGHEAGHEELTGNYTPFPCAFNVLAKV